MRLTLSGVVRYDWCYWWDHCTQTQTDVFTACITAAIKIEWKVYMLSYCWYWQRHIGLTITAMQLGIDLWEAKPRVTYIIFVSALYSPSHVTEQCGDVNGDVNYKNYGLSKPSE